jgi:RNA polymerase sigma-70 factor, ECF subfamily
LPTQPDRDELAREARRIARRVLRRHFICRDDLEDCAQEVVLRVVARIEQLRDPSRFEAWVAAIARHVAHDRQRDDHTLPLPLGYDGAGGAEAPPHGATGGWQAELAQAEERLCSARQELLALRYRQGLSYAEIAERLGVSVPVVRRRLQGARDQLRKEVMRLMASENRCTVDLNRTDLDCLHAAAALADPNSERELCAVHIAGKRVFGGTTHRAAAGVLSCRRDLPELALDSAALCALGDHPEVSTGCLGWGEECARLALDDGTVVEAARLSVGPLPPEAFKIAEWPPPHRAEAARAEFLELAELVAAAAWGWGPEQDPTARVMASLTVSANLIGASVYRHERVAFMLGGSIGAGTPEGVAVQIFLNRAYLRDCLAVLPRTAERVQMDWGGPYHALRFSCVDAPGLCTVMMPMEPPEGVEFRVVTSGT